MDVFFLAPALVGVLTVLLLKSRITDVSRVLIREVTLRHSTLPFAPNSLTRLETVVLFLLAVLKHGLKLAKYFDELAYTDDGYVLPECDVTATMSITETDVAAFKDVFPDAEETEKVTPQKERVNDLFLPCITSVIIPFLLVKFNLPISPLGALNTKNRFEYIDLQACSNPIGRTTLVASIGGDRLGRRTRKGREFDVHVEARMEGRKDPYFRQIFTVLEFLPSHVMPLFDDSRQTQTERSGPDDASNSSTCEITVSHDAPWLWAKFCKDYNPIHISTFVAHLFGFAGRLVHGNHLAAMAIHETGSLMDSQNTNQPQAKSTKQNKGGKHHGTNGRFIEVKFIKPVLLGTTVEVLSSTDGMMTLKRGEQTVMTIRAGDL
ncbi:protein of unknown function [Taphrina deformans PYCC 5710]|uniref:MaoC-like domain-containing protein n=1 Tax=Taphrina deformans (strain PYCC 5710 / ATCC 11124 / CBS 356.35 / IMI 108563 / JCM 9778 / NBRC 8474) TaxID=1097556 RepID=R4XAL8_TAPDE|nr:protein of unknown function [Taphrina deformans PYCC 5710]|eukprot:CCG82838.1 protein of unknown function [Taphrina deformans PYCC 5710]